MCHLKSAAGNVKAWRMMRRHNLPLPLAIGSDRLVPKGDGGIQALVSEPQRGERNHRMWQKTNVELRSSGRQNRMAPKGALFHPASMAASDSKTTLF